MRAELLRTRIHPLRPGRQAISIKADDSGFLSADHYPAASSALDGSRGRPCVVMAHGVGATRDCGLASFAAALSGAGADVIAFDYRNFAESSGSTRQLVSLRGQVRDYHSVIEHARSLPGVDPERIAVWGVSLSGGHVVQVAVEDPRVAAVIALTPAVDGLAAVTQIVRAHGVGHVVKLTRRALADVVSACLRREPTLMPIVGRPGLPGALTAPGAFEGMSAIAGPTWRNEIAARLLMSIAAYRPISRAGQIRCPALVQIADNDQSAPASAATRAATRMKAVVHHYPGDHFDVYPGAVVHDRVLEDQVRFVRRAFEPQSQGEISSAAR